MARIANLPNLSAPLFGQSDGSIEFHPLADIFPMLPKEQLSDLSADIKKNGLLEPIITYRGQIIDGRNRYLACLQAEVEPRMVSWNGVGSILGLISSKNLKRRHLSESQRAMVAVKLANIPKHQHRDGPIGLSVSQLEAAKLMGVGVRSVKRAKVVREQATSEQISAVEHGDKTVTHVVRELKEEKREKRREENKQLVEKTSNPIEVGAKFATIVIDPPWDYSDEGDDDVYGRTRPTYATMPFEEIVELPVASLADMDCHLYLWTTNRSQRKAYRLLDAWGFRFITSITWCKPHIGTGNYFRNSTEHILFGVKGSQLLKRRDVGTWFQAPRGTGGHSSKPAEAYKLIESCSPGPYLEMFARSERDNWVSWGAEIG